MVAPGDPGPGPHYGYIALYVDTHLGMGTGSRRGHRRMERQPMSIRNKTACPCADCQTRGRLGGAAPDQIAPGTYAGGYTDPFAPAPLDIYAAAGVDPAYTGTQLSTDPPAAAARKPLDYGLLAGVFIGAFVLIEAISGTSGGKRRR